jgi:antitoxin CcdA
MSATSKRKTSLSLDAETLDAARDLGLNVSALADLALKQAVAQARRQQWRAENADAFAAQAEWHEKNGHPLAEIMATPAVTTWRS